MAELISDLIADSASPGAGASAASKAAIERLRDRRAWFEKRFDFEEGMLVTWKPGLKHKKSPDYGEPVVVAEVLPVPTRDGTKSGGSAYFREPLDLVCGERIEGQFHLYHMDSRRMMPYDRWLEKERRMLEDLG